MGRSLEQWQKVKDARAKLDAIVDELVGLPVHPMTIKDLPKVEGGLKNDGKAKFVVLGFQNYKKFIQKCELAGRIDESAYMEAYPDVADAVSSGKITSATRHYLDTGYVEGRSAKLLN